MQKVKKDSDGSARDEYRCKDQQIILHIFIHAEKHENADTGVGNESREHGTRRNYAVEEKLGDDNGGRAIGDEPDQG